ncbi:hypothetical protein BCU64_008265 [Vibrio lentus]|nr:hypothetical protein [Vibrio lentus]
MKKSVIRIIRFFEKFINEKFAWVEKLWNGPLYYFMQFVVILCFISNSCAAYNIFTHNDELDFGRIFLTAICIPIFLKLRIAKKKINKEKGWWKELVAKVVEWAQAKIINQLNKELREAALITNRRRKRILAIASAISFLLSFIAFGYEHGINLIKIATMDFNGSLRDLFALSFFELITFSLFLMLYGSLEFCLEWEDYLVNVKLTENDLSANALKGNSSLSIYSAEEQSSAELKKDGAAIKLKIDENGAKSARNN